MLFDYSSQIPAQFLKYLHYFKPRKLDNEGQPIEVLTYFRKGTTGKTILITAGFDGDEWDGILASLTLPEELLRIPTNHSIIILPICNPLGFFAKTSAIPTDGSFPKHYYGEKLPQNEAQKLVRTLFASLPQPFDVWIDLHGGSSHENLVSFVSAYHTSSPSLNRWSQHLLDSCSEEFAYFLTDHHWPKIEALAHDNKTYFLSEAGEGVHFRNQTITLHVSRVLKLLKAMQNEPSTRTNFPLSRMQRFALSFGAWEACAEAGKAIVRGEIVGRVRFFFGLFTFPVKALHDGTLLWIRKSATPPSKEVVFELVYLT